MLWEKQQFEAKIMEPTFYEKRAFIDDFRRKWKEDQGMVSLFDKRQKYKKENERVKSAMQAK